MTVNRSIDRAPPWASRWTAPSRACHALFKFVEALMSAEADAACDVRSDERVNLRNGYRPREWDTRAGTERAI